MSNIIVDADFDKEFLEIFSQDDLKIVGQFIETKLEDYDDSSQTVGDWQLDLDIEKIDCLNHDYHFSFTKEGVENEVTISFNTGINVGCELISFSMVGESPVNTPNEVEVYSHIQIDWDKYCLDHNVKTKDELSSLFVMKVENLFNNFKSDIEDIISRQNYDKYVTGGHSVVCDKAYNKEFERFIKMGLHWEKCYETLVVDRQFI